VSFPGGAGVVVKREVEFRKEFLIYLMKDIHMLFGCASGKLGAHGDGDAILIRSADVEHLALFGALESSEDIAWEVGSGDVPKVEGPVRVWESRRN